jgi:hypothetical protein
LSFSPSLASKYIIINMINRIIRKDVEAGSSLRLSLPGIRM